MVTLCSCENAGADDARFGCVIRYSYLEDVTAAWLTKRASFPKNETR
jgi:hypothetical protein